MSNNNLGTLPLSLSQCSLLKHINISGNQLVRPPAILFSIPWLRTHPENIIFGDNQKCTKELAQSIIEECKSMNQCSISITDLEGNNRKLSFTPDTTSSEFFTMCHPSMSHLISNVIFVRKCGSSVLQFIPDTVPLSLYLLPNATWSFEFKYLPSHVPVSVFPLLKGFVESQLQYVEDQKTSKKISALLEQFKGDDTRDLISFLEAVPCMCARQFHVQYMQNGRYTPLTILVTNNCVTLRFSKSLYQNFNTDSISFDYVDRSCLLFCGGSALVIEEEYVPDLLPLFAMTIRKDQLKIRSEVSPFTALISKSMIAYVRGKDDRMKITREKPKDIKPLFTKKKIKRRPNVKK